MSKACFFVGTQDEKYLVLAICGALEFNFHNPNIDIYVYTDLDKFEEDDFIDQNIKILKIKVEKENINKAKFNSKNKFSIYGKFNNRKYKILGYKYLPKDYDQVLYLDADILPFAGVGNLWEKYSKQDIAFSVDITKTLGGWKYFEDNNIDANFTKKICSPTQTLYNGGVFLANLKNKGAEFLEYWYKEWQRFKILDQLALARTIKEGGFNIETLDEGYNFCPSIARDNSNNQINTVIKHIHLRNWIIPHQNLYNLYEQHSKVCLDILDNFYSRDDLIKLITRKV